MKTVGSKTQKPLETPSDEQVAFGRAAELLEFIACGSELAPRRLRRGPAQG
jgi:hypothetical protein